MFWVPLLLALTISPPPNPPRIIILGYHEVEEDGLPPHEVIPRSGAAPTPDEMERYTISTAAFQQQLDALDRHGYEVIPLADVVDYVDGRRSMLPPRSAVITVDDGWRSTKTEIAAELAKRNWPFTAFVYPRVIDAHSHHPDNLTWSDVAGLAANGADIESHTYSHPLLSRAHSSIADEANYAPFLDDELRCSRAEIENHIQQPVTFLAYPYGDYDDAVIAAAKAAGYDAAVTVTPGLVTRQSNPFALNRYLVVHDTTLQQFEEWLEGP
ncbi:MAG TPA: polysaccharide deacetylase family protein [Thermoanaerobaculia bacterium]|jgi:peptidoglycan/xylan/chitin deacetylase (PgdA/CDA1 family)|nr:polysaccharide deacetylase family protein [Thermoanaerobaculia bacterium]